MSASPPRKRMRSAICSAWCISEMETLNMYLARYSYPASSRRTWKYIYCNDVAISLRKASFNSAMLLAYLLSDWSINKKNLEHTVAKCVPNIHFQPAYGPIHSPAAQNAIRVSRTPRGTEPRHLRYGTRIHAWIRRRPYAASTHRRSGPRA